MKKPRYHVVIWIRANDKDDDDLIFDSPQKALDKIDEMEMFDEDTHYTVEEV